MNKFCFGGEFENVKFDEDMYISKLNEKCEEAERIITEKLTEAATNGQPSFKGNN